MKKIAALDLGDQWVGIALSDSTQNLARPYTTVPAKQLHSALKKLLTEQELERIVVGNPKTMKGTESAQTKKVHAQFQELQVLFPKVIWVLWDERLTSSWAAQLSKNISKEEKLKSHARAAAFILDAYLTFLKNQSSYQI